MKSRRILIGRGIELGDGSFPTLSRIISEACGAGGLGSFYCLIVDTVWKRIRATASFTIPSPKIIENSFGCSSYLTIEMAAITSDEHNKELIKNASIRLSVKVNDL